jgi:hypothetical protein
LFVGRCVASLLRNALDNERWEVIDLLNEYFVSKPKKLANLNLMDEYRLYRPVDIGYESRMAKIGFPTLASTRSSKFLNPIGNPEVLIPREIQSCVAF